MKFIWSTKCSLKKWFTFESLMQLRLWFVALACKLVWDFTIFPTLIGKRNDK